MVTTFTSSSHVHFSCVNVFIIIFLLLFRCKCSSSSNNTKFFYNSITPNVPTGSVCYQMDIEPNIW